MRTRAIPSRREFLVRSTAVAAAAAGSTLWGCSGRNRVEPGDLTELSAADGHCRHGARRHQGRGLRSRIARSIPTVAVPERVPSPRTLTPCSRRRERRTSARASGAALGALHGLPIPVKDSVNTARYATSNGTAILRDFRPTADARVLRPLMDAGGYVMGKTNLHELSSGWTSVNAAFGAVRNPYDTSRVPGGSSGGSAVAVAARMAPLAVAEDTLGSDSHSVDDVRHLRPASDLRSVSRRRHHAANDERLRSSRSARADGRGSGAVRFRRVRRKFSAACGRPEGAFVSASPISFSRISIQRSSASRRRRSIVCVMLVRSSSRAEVPDDVKAAFGAALTILLFERQSAISGFLAEQGTGISFDELVAQVGPNLKATFARPAPAEGGL